MLENFSGMRVEAENVKKAEADPTVDVVNRDGCNVMLARWIDACAKFEHHAGKGVVVGVLWGAYGSVVLNMTSTADVHKWEYGGEANFQFSGLAGSLAVEASYGGENSAMAQHLTTSDGLSHPGR